MAIGDRLRKKIRNRREKAGEVTGKKKYSVMGKTGGRATGTRWVRKKKKKEEPKTSKAKPKTKSELKPDASDMSYTPGTEEQMFRQMVPETELKPDVSDMSYTPGTEEQMFRQQVSETELKPDVSDMSYTPGAEEQMFRQQVSEEINDAVEAKIKSLFQNIIGR